MEKSTKAFVLIVLSVLLVCTIIFSGYRSFVSAIRNQRTCEWANIDNIELYAHIDIPKVTTWECDYQKVVNTKKAHFTIDTKDFDINRYIQLYKFEALPADSQIALDNFLNLQADSIVMADIYYKEGFDDGEKWDVLVDKRAVNFG
jgi:Na+-transporting NADH:ubiquinone oxidoreductase subunit NqrC